MINDLTLDDVIEKAQDTVEKKASEWKEFVRANAKDLEVGITEKAKKQAEDLKMYKEKYEAMTLDDIKTKAQETEIAKMALEWKDLAEAEALVLDKALYEKKNQMNRRDKRHGKFANKRHGRHPRNRFGKRFFNDWSDSSDSWSDSDSDSDSWSDSDSDSDSWDSDSDSDSEEGFFKRMFHNGWNNKDYDEEE